MLDFPAAAEPASGMVGTDSGPAEAPRLSASAVCRDPIGAAGPGILDLLTTVPTRPDGSAVLVPQANAGTIGIGSVLRERFELVAYLGRGGMGTVYKARDLRRAIPGTENNSVALKIVGPEPSAGIAASALVREFRQLQRLSHPNIVNVFDIDEVGEACFYTMELLDGRRLSEEIGRGGLLPRHYALSIVRQIGSALAYAHAHGVVHGDLKPDNIMLSLAADVRVMDFGGVMSPELSPSETPHEEHLSLITPAYASCEQLEGWPPDESDDVYALACIAYLLLMGHHPFEERSALHARSQCLRPHRPPGLGSQQWRALRWGLALSRAERPRDVAFWTRQIAPEATPGVLLPFTRFRADGPRRVRVGDFLTGATLLVMVGLSASTVLTPHGLEPPRPRAGIDGALEAGRQAGPPLAVAPSPSAPSPSAPSPSAPSAPPAPRTVPVVAFSASSYVVPDSKPVARIIIRRTRQPPPPPLAPTLEQFQPVVSVTPWTGDTPAGAITVPAAEGPPPPPASTLEQFQPVVSLTPRTGGAPAGAITIPAAEGSPPTLPATPRPVIRVAGGPGPGFPNTEHYYPVESRRLGETGLTTLSVCVNGVGRLTADPVVAQSSGSARLDTGAVKLAKAASGHYRPMTEDGRRVSGCYSLGIRFALKD